MPPFVCPSPVASNFTLNYSDVVMGSWQVSPNLGLAGVVGWSKITAKSLFCYPLSRDVGPNGATAEYFLSAGWGWGGGGHIYILPVIFFFFSPPPPPREGGGW